MYLCLNLPLRNVALRETHSTLRKTIERATAQHRGSTIFVSPSMSQPHVFLITKRELYLPNTPRRQLVSRSIFPMVPPAPLVATFADAGAEKIVAKQKNSMYYWYSQVRQQHFLLLEQHKQTLCLQRTGATGAGYLKGTKQVFTAKCKLPTPASLCTNICFQ